MRSWTKTKQQCLAKIAAKEINEETMTTNPDAKQNDALLDPDMPQQELLLHMGEMTEQEIRTARATIRWANTRATIPASPLVGKNNLAKKLIQTFENAKDEVRWYKSAIDKKDGAGTATEIGRLIGAENILAEFRDVTRMAESIAAMPQPTIPASPLVKHPKSAKCENCGWQHEIGECETQPAVQLSALSEDEAVDLLTKQYQHWQSGGEAVRTDRGAMLSAYRALQQAIKTRGGA